MTRAKYTYSDFFTGVKNPGLIFKEFERLISSSIFKYKHEGGIDVMDRDWDNLIILDACRYDYFKKYNRIDGELEKVVSSSSSSIEFIESNFQGRQFHDTILVTANPFVENIADKVFFRVFYSEVLDKWDDDLKTVPPNEIVTMALKKHAEFPNKRIIVHMMQPHTPYIGETGRRLNRENEFGVFNPTLNNLDVPEIGLQDAVKKGIATKEELRQAYTENVQIALNAAEDLINSLNGKSVITSDHGEMLGERALFFKHYGHPGRLHTSELRILPWHVVSSEERRELTTGTPKPFKKLNQDTRSSRLKALGYI